MSTIPTGIIPKRKTPIKRDSIPTPIRTSGLQDEQPPLPPVRTPLNFTTLTVIQKKLQDLYNAQFIQMVKSGFASVVESNVIESYLAPWGEKQKIISGKLPPPKEDLARINQEENQQLPSQSNYLEVPKNDSVKSRSRSKSPSKLQLKNQVQNKSPYAKSKK